MGLFMVRNNIKLTPNFYNHIAKRFNSKELVMYSRLVSYGRTSMNLSLKLINPENEEEILGEYLMKFVTVNTTTKRTTPVPQWFIESYYSAQNEKSSTLFEDVTFDSTSASAFRTKIHTRASDLDPNKHVNASLYYLFCMECASKATSYPVIEFDMSFQGESGSDEELTVSTWQDSKDTQLLFFAIYLYEKCIVKAYARFGRATIRIDQSYDIPTSKL